MLHFCNVAILSPPKLVLLPVKFCLSIVQAAEAVTVARPRRAVWSSGAGLESPLPPHPTRLPLARYFLSLELPYHHLGNDMLDPGGPEGSSPVQYLMTLWPRWFGQYTFGGDNRGRIHRTWKPNLVGVSRLSDFRVQRGIQVTSRGGAPSQGVTRK